MGLWRGLETGQRKLFVRGGMPLILSIWWNKLQRFMENFLLTAVFWFKETFKCGLCCRHFTLWVILLSWSYCDSRLFHLANDGYLMCACKGTKKWFFHFPGQCCNGMRSPREERCICQHSCFLFYSRLRPASHGGDLREQHQPVWLSLRSVHGLVRFR